jgi:hypothetical protein
MTCRRLLCLLLCMATWRGPVVWVHSHSDHASSEAAEHRLSSHLRRFHHEASPGERSRWHLHIGLLRDLMTDDCDEETPPSQSSMDEPICLTVASDVSLPASVTAGLSFDVFSIATSPAALSLSASPSIPRGSFLQTYGTAPLRALTCVIRC